MFRSALLCTIALASLMLVHVSASGADPVNSLPTIDVSRANPMPVFPAMARIRHEKGTAVIYVNVDEAGNATGVKLGKTSGYLDLDNAALAAVREWHFHPAIVDGKPAGKWTAVGVLFTAAGVKDVPVDIDAELSGQQAADDANNPQKIICKQDVGATGSHLQGPRVCHTQKQWDDMAARAQRSVQKSLDNPGTQLGGP